MAGLPGSGRARRSATARSERAAGRSRSPGRSGRPPASSGSGSAETAPDGAVLTADRPAAADATRARRPQRPVRRWPWILAAALSAVLVIAAVVVVYLTPLLGLRSIVITAGDTTGANGAVAAGTLDPAVDASIRAAAGVPDGTPLARIDLSGIAERVRDIPQVDAVEVARSWPNAVTIIVTPRVPAAVTSANGQLWLMDDQGVAYQPVAAAPAGLVTVKLATPGPGDPGTEAAMAVIASFTDAFRGQVAAVSARTAYDVTVALTDGRTVVWGGADQSARKMQVLPALLEQKGSEYDVSDPTLVSVR